MALWIIEPHDPLIVRDGRPFGPNPGARANSLSFPFPSTTTGGVRSRAGLQNGGFDKEMVKRVKRIKVRGPLLAQLKPDSDELRWLIPAPADALLFPNEQESSIVCKQLVPLQRPVGAETDFDSETKSDQQKSDLTSEKPAGTATDLDSRDVTDDRLMLVGLVEPDPNKPTKNAPHYWYWESFQEWLLNPPPAKGKTIGMSELGHNGPQREQRTHVSIDENSYAAREGALFATSGLEFTYTGGKEEKRLGEAERLALVVAVDDNAGLTIAEGLAGFGGERRPVSWRKSNRDFPLCPPTLGRAIINQGACRVFLLTPAYFKSGYRPEWLVEPRNGVIPNLEAIAIQRPQVVSGWDLEHGKPKPTRRLAPAGTVLFLSLKGNDQGAMQKWINDIWMHCISDEEQACYDGFGLAVLGTWSGKRAAMKKEQS